MQLNEDESDSICDISRSLYFSWILKYLMVDFY